MKALLIHNEIRRLCERWEMQGEDETNLLPTLLDQLVRLVQHWERRVPRSVIVEAMLPLRTMAGLSPFVRRAQVWPRGYQGDYETILYLLENRNRAEESCPGFAIEEFFLRSPICEQHRQKVAYQARCISVALKRKKAARILSIGCGPSEDIFRCLPLLRESAGRVTLVDQDEGALAYSFNRLSPVADRIEFIKGNISRVVHLLKDAYDLVLIGGVFDYLPDRAIAVLLRQLSAKLNRGGEIVFTNIAKGNPFRVHMEYLANWVLIERGRSDLCRLLQTAGVPWPFSITKDPTGLAFLVHVKASDGSRSNIAGELAANQSYIDA